MSSLPEIHLLPADLKSIIELVKTHDREMAEKLDESYHSASFNVTDHTGPVCFISHAMTHEEAMKIQEWLLREESSGDAAEKVRYFGHLVNAWRSISRKHL